MRISDLGLQRAAGRTKQRFWEANFGVRRFVLAVLLCFLFWNRTDAGQIGLGETASSSRQAIDQYLRRPIIGTDITTSEVQAYLESRIPNVPAVKDAASWQKQAEKLRELLLERVVLRGKGALWKHAITRVEWIETIEGGEGYKIKKLRFEALPGMWIPALLYEPEKPSGKMPGILNLNGHDLKGKAAPYNQIRCINLAKRGMLALNVESFGTGQFEGKMEEHYRMNQLDLCGTSGLAPFYLSLKRALDILLSLENVDPNRIAVAGLADGAWQTLIISALDSRVALSNPVAGYSSFRTRIRYVSDLGGPAQTPSDLASYVDYTHLTGMLAPRPALLTYNANDDCCFGAGHALPPLLAASRPIYKIFGKEDYLRSHVNYNPGTHNFSQENREQFYKMLGEHFFIGSQFEWREIESDKELKSDEQLMVPLPKENLTFNSLALELSKELPFDSSLPADSSSMKRWQQTRRNMLHEVVRTRNYQAQAEQTGIESSNGVQATFWKLRLGGVWTIPVVELVKGTPSKTALLVSDSGRSSVAEQCERLLELNYRVLAIDPFYFGEAKLKEREPLFALMIAAIGDRPVGLQASQIVAVSRWCQAQFLNSPCSVFANGHRSSAFALIAAALEENAIAGLEISDSLGSFKEILEKNWTAEQSPELFCFGLLERFDVRHLVALAAPRPVKFTKSSKRVITELETMPEWFARFGTTFPTPE